MSSIRELIGAVVFFIAAALFLRMIVSSVLNLLSGRSSGTVTAAATVLSKSAAAGSGEFGKDGIRTGKEVYSAEFALDSGSVTFELSASEWRSLTEGDRGSLTYRGKQYLGFEPDNLL